MVYLRAASICHSKVSSYSIPSSNPTFLKRIFTFRIDDHKSRNSAYVELFPVLFIPYTEKS